MEQLCLDAKKVNTVRFSRNQILFFVHLLVTFYSECCAYNIKRVEMFDSGVDISRVEPAESVERSLTTVNIGNGVVLPAVQKESQSQMLFLSFH